MTGDPVRVLVLEDHPERQEVFRRLFPGCVVVSNYVEAVSAFSGLDTMRCGSISTSSSATTALTSRSI